MEKYIFFFLLIIYSQAMYSDDDVFYCNEPFTEDELSDLIQIQPIDRYIFLVGTPFAFFCTLFITFTFIKYPSTRKMPSDIVFFISLSDCILCIHWFVTALYFTIYQDSPLSGGAFCQINSMFSIFAGTGEVAYNIVFCLYLRLTFKNQFKVIPKLPCLLHSLAWIAMISVPLLAYVTDQNGLSLFGTCSFKYHPGFPIAGILLVASYTLISCYTIYYFKNTIPDDEKYKEQKENFTKYYYSYVLGSCIIWTIEAVCFTIAGFNCQSFHKGYLLVFLTIGNSAKLCTPIVLSILRYNDPTIKRQVKKVFQKFFNKRSQIHAESLESLIDANLFEGMNQDLQQDQVYTIISGIRFICRNQSDNCSSIIESNDMGQFNIQRRETENKIRTDSIFGSDVSRISDVHNIQFEDVNEEITYKLEENNSKLQLKYNQSLKLTASTIIVYAPKVFQRIRDKDAAMINLFDSFDPEANYTQIKQFKGVDGGKGGAFFFFTYDNKLIIKTITDGELLAFRKKLIPYFLHLEENETVISPIYGIYKFQRVQANESINVVVMRNAIQIPSNFKIRTYDIKGSAYQRQVLKNTQSFLNLELTKITLKDMDFKKLEQNKINIPEHLKNKLSDCLIRDAQFFSKVKFMDYSLLLLKVDWQSYLGQQYDEKNVVARFTSDLYCIPSTLENEKGIFYHFAIIDYLQEWNAQKMLEKTTKKAINANISLDTSAQSPEDYANRFIEKVAKAIIQN